MNAIPTLRDGVTVLRPIRVRDARALERELIESRTWLRPWEATSPSERASRTGLTISRGMMQVHSTKYKVQSYHVPG